MVKRYRQGARNTFAKQAEALLFSGRKTLSTRATFVGVLTLGTIFGAGAVATFAYPEIIGQQRGPNQIITGSFATGATYGMYKAAQDMASNWWKIER